MGKNWLIRTKSNHILGPISKDKVLELFQNGSIKADDEVCSGNGYWFYIREEDLVEKYLIGKEQQGFNPISEAKDILTQPGEKPPVMDEDITLVGGINLKGLNEKTPPKGTTVSSVPTSKKEAAPEIKKKANIAPAEKPLPPRKLKPKGPKPQLKKENYLQYLAVICFVALLAAIWYRKTIFKYFKESEISLALISSAHAQEQSSAEKKKSLNK